MNRVLHIQASPRPADESWSARAAHAFLDAYARHHPDDRITTLELFRATLPAFDQDAAGGKYKLMHGQPLAAAEEQAWDLVREQIARFLAADKLVFSVPMWNFSIPYRLKQYLDILVQPGFTVHFDPQEGYRGLVTGRPALLVLARGSTYAPETPTAAFDFQLPYLKALLGFIGITQLHTVVVEPTLAGGRAAAEAALAKARTELAALAADF
ncbi:MAG: NAD(P)H-dependent oxidoreductase [Lentisphaeria bacterium]